MAISLSRAVEGFNLHLAAEGASDHTLQDYNTTLSRFVQFCGPLTVPDTISPNQIRRFLAYWQGKTVAPPGVAPRPPRTLAPKTILNMHTALSSFWSWLVMEGYAEEHIIKGRVARPRVPPPDIQPLSTDQITALIQAASMSDRNRAIVLFALDTGARASEICDLTHDRLDLAAKTATINGKGNKTRTVVFGRKTGRALFRYMAGVDEDPRHGRVFSSLRGDPLTRSALLQMIRRMGKRAGINRLYPHRLRHTFAIHYLRNGGDVMTLQRQLGHSSMDMVRRYLQIAGADLERVHRRASPVDNLKN